MIPFYLLTLFLLDPDELVDEDAIEEEEDRVKHNKRLVFWRSLLFPGSSDLENQKTLPHWLLYVAYILALVSAFVSAFFVILYGFDFGKEKRIFGINA